MPNKLLQFAEGFLALFYPKTCLACNDIVVGNEEILCTGCRQTLPETGFHQSIGNPVELLLWGRIPIERATALLYFDKGSKYRRLVHQLKYRGKEEVGIILGKMLGARLQEGGFSTFDYIVPIPLHKAKLRRRGYNQSELIARGISDIVIKPIVSNILYRQFYSGTQTSKNRFQRFQNVEGIFNVKDAALLKNKHVLLVDDVITTGATIEAAATILLQNGISQISVAALGVAN